MQFPVPSETFATTDVRELRRLGHEVRVLTLRAPHRRHRALLRERALEDLSLDVGGVGPSLGGAAALLRRPCAALGAAGETWRDTAGGDLRWRAVALLPRVHDVAGRLARWRPDVVHAYWGHYPAMVLRLVQQRLPGVVTSLSLGAYDLLARFGPSRRAGRDADWVRTHAVVNRAAVAAFLGREASRVEVVHNGIDLERVRAIAATQRRVPGRVVSAGRLIEAKGMTDVLDLLATLAAHWPRASLTVLGEGPQRAALERRARRLGLGARVRFLGHVPHDRAIEEMARGEVMTLMTRHEAERLPNVLKEAMACGCVPVTTSSPGIEELVEPDVGGYVVPDVSAAVRAIDDLWRHPERFEALRARGGARVARDFDVARTMSHYVRAWTVARAAKAPLPSGGPS